MAQSRLYGCTLSGLWCLNWGDVVVPAAVSLCMSWGCPRKSALVRRSWGPVSLHQTTDGPDCGAGGGMQPGPPSGPSGADLNQLKCNQRYVDFAMYPGFSRPMSLIISSSKWLAGGFFPSYLGPCEAALNTLTAAPDEVAIQSQAQ